MQSENVKAAYEWLRKVGIMIPSETPSKSVNARHFDICHSDYVCDWRDTVVGIPLMGQTASQMADEVIQELNARMDFDEEWEGITDEQIRVAILECLKPEARFWPCDDSGNEIETDDPEDPRLQSEQPCAWFRLTVEDSNA